ncbi:MAG: sulfite exporter TauE/SafE family protein [Gammaproteobacteria bacterium]|nr:sulfite exporter TauE/SafE family protein [Gammaproteobacteria bacterium]
MTEAQILLLTTASVAFLHTMMGPDHYVVFTAMGKARDWSLFRTLRITLFCGIGHVLSSIVIGAIGLILGAQLASLMEIESMRGNLAGWALLAFGLMYFAWGLRKAGRDRSHSHVHAHGEVVHDHEHDHHDEHMHVHDQQAPNSITPWAIFIILVLGPCEALIPLFMYPAAQQSAGLVMSVALVFGAVTLATMLALVAITSIGLDQLKLPVASRRYAHAIAGASVALCGGAISFTGF